MPIKKRKTRKEKIEDIQKHKKHIRNPTRKTKEQYIDYNLAKIDHALANAQRFSRLGFYPMAFFDCVKERKNFKYCGSCRMYDICRTMGWIMYTFDPMYLTHFPDPEVPEAIRMLLRAYKRKLLFQKKLCRNGKKFKKDVWLTIQKGLPKEYDEEFYRTKSEYNDVEAGEEDLELEEEYVELGQDLEDEDFDQACGEDKVLLEMVKKIEEEKRRRRENI
jgi:hypothetical protein